MGRLPRCFVCGEIYHIVQRGNNRAFIYRCESDKKAFVNIVRSVAKKLSFELLYYVLMNNHYHLVIRMTHDSISRVMQRINWLYSRYFNKKYARCGTIYGQRFKSYFVKNYRYLRALIKYIAMNPVRSGLVKNPGEYRWSAHYDMLRKRSRIINRNQLLVLFDNQVDRAFSYYQYLVDEEEVLTLRDDMKDLHHKDRLEKMRIELKLKIKDFGNVKRKIHELTYVGLHGIKTTLILYALSRGYSAREVAAVFNIPLHNVYYLGNKYNQHWRNRRKQHQKDRQNITAMATL